MNKLEHLSQCKQFLRKVLRQRRMMLNQNISGKANDRKMSEIIAGMEYMIGNAHSFDQMYNYINQKGVQQKIKYLIPSRFKKWREELTQLITKGYNLKHQVAKQTELSF